MHKIHILFFIAVLSITAFSQQKVIEAQGNSAAPVKAVSAYKELMAYIRKTTPNIASDEMAQNRWLSKTLKSAFLAKIKRAGNPRENPDFPSNATFLKVWNTPMTYKIVGSRSYSFRDSDNPKGVWAIIDVLYEWDKTKSIENQYPGQKQFYSFIFLMEEGSWKLDDIYTFDADYTTTDSLKVYLKTVQ